MKKILLASIVLLSSCAPVYVPNLRNSPLFTQAGEFQGSFQMGNGLDLQGAVSITNNIALMGNFSYADRRSGNDLEKYHYQKYFEGAIGYYKNDEKMCYEIFAGIGKGEGAGLDRYSTLLLTPVEIQTSGKYKRYFIQPAFGLNKKVMHVSFVARFSFVDMYEFIDETNGINYYNSPLAVFIEPAVVGKVNVADGNLFFTFQAGASALITGQPDWDRRPFQLGAGFGFRIGGKKKVK